MRLLALTPLLVAALSCAASHHDFQPADLGQASSAEAMRATLASPGPIAFERVVAANWVVDRSGLINLDHPTSRRAGIEPGDEQIQLYFYVLRHPRFGNFIVDSGVEQGFRDPEGNERIGALVEAAMQTERLDVHATTGDWLSERDMTLDGVFLTHIHMDHIMGVPDLPGVPVYSGPGETGASAFLNLFTRGTTDALLGAAGPLREWRFEPDASGRFAGVVDVFGDASLFAIHVPGHSPGSTAFLARTVDGPKLLVGDACHTRWGWENGVEPGTFSLDQPQSAQSLAALRALAAEFPQIEVHLGHQNAGPEGKLVPLEARAEASALP